MTVSIIIPHLENGAGYLNDCLASIESQAFRDVQIIVEEDDRIKPLGVAAMRNRGLQKATGDYILFIDSDDFLNDGALSMAVEEAALHPGCIIRMPIRKTPYKYSTAIEVERKDRAAKERLAREQLAIAAACKTDTEAVKQGTTGETDTEAVKQGTAGETDTTEVSGRSDGPTATIAKTVEVAVHGMYETCLGQLIPREVCADLLFNESLRLYCDIPFCAQLWERAEVVILQSPFYFSRTHNDPVAHPAISQKVSKGRFTEYVKAAEEAASYMADPASMGKNVCRFLISRTVRGNVPKAAEWTNKDILQLGALVAKIGLPSFVDYKGEELKALKCYASQDIKGVRRCVKRHHKKVAFKELKRSRYKRRIWIYKKLFTKLPVKKNLVLFSSFFGRNYCDSPRAIYEYMQKNYPEKRFVWLMNNDTEIPGKCKKIKSNSLKYFYVAARAGAFVTNVRQPEWYIKRKGTMLLQTWHGTPLKRLVFDLEDVYASKPLDYKKFFYKQARQWNYLISDNEFSSGAFGTAFRYPKNKMLEMGYPRNDILYASDKEDRAAALKEKLGLPADKKVVLYAPTWRDDEIEGVGAYGFTLQLDIGRLRELKDEYVFLLRTHYLISDNLKLDEADRDFVFDLSSYNDISELYLITDVLVTDYSSVFFDFANLRRPMLFYVYDYEKYRDVLHGFYFDMNEGCPGPMLKTMDELVAALKNIPAITEEYKEVYDSFCERFCYLDDGHAAQRVVEKVFGSNTIK